MFAPKTILVPTDFSDCSERAVQAAVEIAIYFRAKITLFHVISEHIRQCTVDYCLTEEAVAQLERDILDSIRNRLNKTAATLQGNGKLEAAVEIARGVPYEEILKAQREGKNDLIVIASHGRTGLLKHLIGSVAEKVMRGATCPVLLVR